MENQFNGKFIFLMFKKVKYVKLIISFYTKIMTTFTTKNTNKHQFPNNALKLYKYKDFFNLLNIC